MIKFTTTVLKIVLKQSLLLVLLYGFNRVTFGYVPLDECTCMNKPFVLFSHMQ